MQGSFIRFYVDENQSHHGVLLWEWLLNQANELGLSGGSAFRAIGGFGQRHNLHEDRFFELAGTARIKVEFVVSDDEANALIELVKKEGIRVFYARMPALFEVINSDKVN